MNNTESTKKLKAVSASEFEACLQETKTPVLVDFAAPWCHPCRMLDPQLAKLNDKLKEKVQLQKINIDMTPEVARKYGVMSIPTLLLLDEKGQEVHRMQAGSYSYDQLESEVLEYL